MKRLLIRGGKTPFDAVDALDTFDRNTIGNNNGNLVFQAAAHKLLSTAGTTVDAHGYSFHPNHAAKVNSEYDGFVLPLANALRLSHEGHLRALTGFIKKLNIPFIMLSGGAQSGPDGSFEVLKPMESTIKAFFTAVLEKSSHITVRGNKTADYVRSLGFSDVLTIGCPSITMNGPGHHVVNPVAKDRYRVAYNIETSKNIFGAVVQNIEDNHDATYFPQDMSTFEMMLWGTDRYPESRDPRLPMRSSHRQFTEQRAEFMLDASTWIRRMQDFDFSAGPRIHGNIAAILAGTPAVVFAHDSRTQELAEYHEIPHFRPDELEDVHSFEQVIERADFTAFNAGHTERFHRVADFLDKNGFHHIYEPGQEAARHAYEQRLRTTVFPSPQMTEWADASPVERKRLQRSREFELKTNKIVSNLRRELAETKNHVANLVAAGPA